MQHNRGRVSRLLWDMLLLIEAVWVYLGVSEGKCRFVGENADPTAHHLCGRFLVETNMSWHARSMYATRDNLTESRFRAVLFYDYPTNNCSGGSEGVYPHRARTARAPRQVFEQLLQEMVYGERSCRWYLLGSEALPFPLIGSG